MYLKVLRTIAIRTTTPTVIENLMLILFKTKSY